MQGAQVAVRAPPTPGPGVGPLGTLGTTRWQSVWSVRGTAPPKPRGRVPAPFRALPRAPLGQRIPVAGPAPLPRREPLPPAVALVPRNQLTPAPTLLLAVGRGEGALTHPRTVCGTGMTGRGARPTRGALTPHRPLSGLHLFLSSVPTESGSRPHPQGRAWVLESPRGGLLTPGLSEMPQVCQGGEGALGAQPGGQLWSPELGASIPTPSPLWSPSRGSVRVTHAHVLRSNAN